MSTDIVLLQPRCGLMDTMGVRVPNGLLTIAAIPVNVGYNVVLIDQRIDNDWEKKLEYHINQGAKLVCLTTMVGEQILHMMWSSKFIKSISKDVLVVLGGSWAQIQPEMCAQDENIDVICYGEGDYLLTDLMEYMEGKRRIEDVLGILYRENGLVKKTAPRPQVENLDTLPKIPYDLVDLKTYTAVGYRHGKPSIALVTSRGCQFRCTFCSIVTLSRQTWRGYSVGRLMEDLAELESKYGIKDFFFSDDLISGNHKRLVEFVDALAECGRDYNWGTSGIRADAVWRLDERTMNQLIKSGCRNLDVGVESGNPRVLKLVKKDTTLDVISQVNKKLSKYPIIVKYTFVGGYPTETEEEFLDTMRFRRKLLEENPYAVAPVFFYTPFPDTAMFQLAIENGFNPPKTLIEWADFNFTTWYKKYPCWLTKRKIKLVENACFLSYFSTKRLGYKYSNPLFNSLFKMYHPLAKFRYDNDFYGLMFEKHLADFIGKLNYKFNIFGRSQKFANAAASVSDDDEKRPRDQENDTHVLLAEVEKQEY